MSLMIGVYPGFQEINLTPGQTYSGSFYVINTGEPGTDNVKYRLIAASYDSISESIDKNFENIDEHFQIVNWIEFDEPAGEIAPESKQLVRYRVNVPEFATAGGQYGAIMVRIDENPKEEHEGINVGAAYQVANIIYGTVDGKLSYSGNIIDNKIKTISLNSPITASSLVKNTGNVHTDIKTNFQVFSFFSGEEIYDAEDDGASNIVIPGATKETINSWESTPALGLYRVIQSVAVAGDISTESSIVFVAPTWFIVVWIAFFSSCIAWIFVKKRSRKHLLKKRSAVSHKNITR